MQIEQHHVLLNTSIKLGGGGNFKLLQEMTKRMAKESETHIRKNDTESSEEEEEDEYN
jgi:hypothetical protein